MNETLGFRTRPLWPEMHLVTQKAWRFGEETRGADIENYPPRLVRESVCICVSMQAQSNTSHRDHICILHFGLTKRCFYLG